MQLGEKVMGQLKTAYSLTYTRSRLPMSTIEIKLYV